MQAIDHKRKEAFRDTLFKCHKFCVTLLLCVKGFL